MLWLLHKTLAAFTRQPNSVIFMTQTNVTIWSTTKHSNVEPIHASLTIIEPWKNYLYLTQDNSVWMTCTREATKDSMFIKSLKGSEHIVFEASARKWIIQSVIEKPMVGPSQLRMLILSKWQTCACKATSRLMNSTHSYSLVIVAAKWCNNPPSSRHCIIALNLFRTFVCAFWSSQSSRFQQ